MKLNLTPMQFIGILLVINGALIGSTAQLTDLLGAHMAHIVISVASLGNSVLGGVVTMFTSQGAQVKNVLAMDGIDSVKVNAKANTTLAQIAVDPTLIKIDAIPSAQAAVTKTAEAV